MDTYIKELKIGNEILKNNIITAPMAGITDLPFRRVLDKFEPGLAHCEMVSTNAIYYNDNKTRSLLKTDGIKGKTSFQIFGSDLESIEYTTKFLSNNYDMTTLDINMGCPAPKVVKNGGGAMLLTDLEKAKKIIQIVVKNSRVPVSVKMRLGYDKDNFVADKLAKICEDEGVSAITVHGRYRSQFYSDTSDLEKIKKIKESVEIPVIGNGDITNSKIARKYFEYAKVDGIMLARGLVGSPWIIKQIHDELKGEKFEISKINKKEIILEHLKNSYELKGLTGIKEFRKHLAMYCKSMENATTFRIQANKIEEYCELKELINNFF